MSEGKDTSHRIMVVDDSPGILSLYESFLKSEGFKVFLYEDAFVDTVEVEHLQPDVIILDYFLDREPRGWGMLKLLRSKRATEAIPVLMVSAVEEDARQIERALNAYGVPLLLKPFRLDELLAAIHRAIDGRDKDNDVPVAPPRFGF